jgi:metal-sulfur cluster biosynthetic enzyme
VARTPSKWWRWLVTLALVTAGVLIASLPTLVRSCRLSRPYVGPVTVVDSTLPVPGIAPADSARVAAALWRINDPELGFSVAELGLVHSLSVDSAGDVALVLAVTTPECPYIQSLAGLVAAGLKLVPGVRRVRVTLDPRIAWDPALLSGEARERYNHLFGNAPDSGR